MIATTIVALPTDVLVLIFELLTIPTLVSLSQTCKHLYFAVCGVYGKFQRPIIQPVPS